MENFKPFALLSAKSDAELCSRVRETPALEPQLWYLHTRMLGGLAIDVHMLWYCA